LLTPCVAPDYSLSRFYLAAALAHCGNLVEAWGAVEAGLALDPTFTIAHFVAGAYSDNPVYLAGRERLIEGMRQAGVPEGCALVYFSTERGDVADAPRCARSGAGLTEQRYPQM
jgi:hypothetical protein